MDEVLEEERQKWKDANQKLIPERNKKLLPIEMAKSFHPPEFTVAVSTILKKPRSHAK